MSPNVFDSVSISMLVVTLTFSPPGVAWRALGLSAAARLRAAGRLRVVEDQGQGAKAVNLW